MKKTGQISFTALLIFLLYSCAPSLKSIYNSDYPLSGQREFSRTGSISLSVPEDWFAVEENEKNIFDIWIVKNDYSSTMNLIPLYYDGNMNNKSEQDETRNLLTQSKYFRQVELGSNFRAKKEEIFELNNRLFGAYQYTSKNNSPTRVVVFKYKQHAFEFTATCEKPEVCDSLYLMELYKTQNSALSSIKE